MRIAIATDAWSPQINGVVTSLKRTSDELDRLGHEILVLQPGEFRTFACPTYPEIRLAWRPGRRIAERLRAFAPEAVHIATEGPIGWSVRAWCKAHGVPFTTSYHTRFPEYVRLRTGIPLSWSYGVVRRFHRASRAVMVATATLRDELAARGFERLVLWSRGVDTELFRPQPKDYLADPRPISMFVGRVAVEKNIEAFLRLDLPGTKYVVGGGPDFERLRTRYPDVRFTGYRQGEELARHVAAADVFVFPSRTDTFGLVLIEALACGVPVAAYPVQGPIDIIENGVTGFLDEDLGAAATRALALDPAACRQAALRYTWAACTQQFVAHVQATQADSALIPATRNPTTEEQNP